METMFLLNISNGRRWLQSLLLRMLRNSAGLGKFPIDRAGPGSRQLTGQYLYMGLADLHICYVLSPFAYGLGKFPIDRAGPGSGQLMGQFLGRKRASGRPGQGLHKYGVLSFLAGPWNARKYPTGHDGKRSPECLA
ncbi:hypothetical protein AMTR_s00080p00053660 [Amborella trichopoda]|uniref:Uncharacterized protein n=1 Tax=Amborella trichopoda TaxID=13333 RepID=W1P4U3_AMBTC|nr:hypothetical protein AMTR_s00080p00053660 [Amborella trichopoda]